MSVKHLKVPNTRDPLVWFSFIQKHLEVSHYKILEVNFNSINFLEADDFVVLACLIEHYYLNGSSISFTGGTKKFNIHLENIKFKKYWTSGFDRDKFTKSRNQSTLCLWHISENLIYAYSDFAKQYVQSIYKGERKDLTPLASNIQEVLNNIFDHSKSRVSGYVIAQYYPKTKELFFAVCDFGIGIPTAINSFRKNRNETILSDEDALECSLELGYSTRSTPRNRGMGLHNIYELVHSSNGSLWITSNSGSLLKNKDRISKDPLPFNFNGTLIKVTIDLSTFDNYIEEEDVFSF